MDCSMNYIKVTSLSSPRIVLHIVVTGAICRYNSTAGFLTMIKKKY